MSGELFGLCPRRREEGYCVGCCENGETVLLGLSLRDDVTDEAKVVTAIAALLHEALGAENPYPTPWTLHRGPRYNLRSREWVITAPKPEKP